jgi:hypothetical protein
MKPKLMYGSWEPIDDLIFRPKFYTKTPFNLKKAYVQKKKIEEIPPIMLIQILITNGCSPIFVRNFKKPSVLHHKILLRVVILNYTNL